VLTQKGDRYVGRFDLNGLQINNVEVHSSLGEAVAALAEGVAWHVGALRPASARLGPPIEWGHPFSRGIYPCQGIREARGYSKMRRFHA
jgi:hypothetical protein